MSIAHTPSFLRHQNRLYYYSCSPPPTKASSPQTAFVSFCAPSNELFQYSFHSPSPTKVSTAQTPFLSSSTHQSCFSNTPSALRFQRKASGDRKAVTTAPPAVCYDDRTKVNFAHLSCALSVSKSHSLRFLFFPPGASDLGGAVSEVGF